MTSIGRRQSILAFSLLTLACRTESKARPSPTTPAEQTYEVRGTIVAIDTEASRVDIRHEAIADFVAASGEKVGMPSMVMPFQVGPMVNLQELGIGQKVRFVLESRLHSQPELFIPSMSRLPDDEVLRLEKP